MRGLVTSSYPAWAEDPSGCFVADRAAMLAERDVVQVLAPVPQDRVERDGRVQVRSVGVAGAEARRRLAAGVPDVLETRGEGVRRAAATLALAITHATARMAGGWQAVESHWIVPCGLAVAMVVPGVPHEAWAHSGDVGLLERLPGGGLLARMVMGSGARLSFVSADLRDRFAALVGPGWAARVRDVSRVQALEPPAVFSAARDKAELRRRLELTRPTVVAAGRMVPIKRFCMLILALARMPSAVRPALVLLGDGPERPRLQALAGSTGVELRLPGVVSRKVVADWLSAADLCVVPSGTVGSRTEGFPLIASEALAVGTRVIVTGSGGLRELAARNPGQVALVDGAPEALARAIATALGR